MAIIRVTKISLFIVLLSVLSYGATAQSGCTKTLIGLSPCLNYVTGNSSTPSPSCCSQLSNVVKSQPQCLCLLLNGTASSYGINVNQTLALALPGVCGVQTPSASRCNGKTRHIYYIYVPKCFILIFGWLVCIQLCRECSWEWTNSFTGWSIYDARDQAVGFWHSIGY